MPESTPSASTEQRRPGPRDRLLRAARKVTYEQGVGVGVDAILKEADVARRSLYQHFGGKDELIAAVLRESADADLARYQRGLEEGGDDPRARVLNMFDVITAALEDPRYRGCRYTTASLVLPAAHPAHLPSADFKRRLRELLVDELERLGHPAPVEGAVELALLVDGAMAASVTQPDVHPARVARRLAERILDDAPGGDGGRA